ncbi:hypothetical protein IE81DRAFT_194779 [Ceraceosorus guamensis]|uniref:Uncharacterized protein n=1 Tax=Ceraceosorus guamensis TaxID=1522189 RepID=A0A316WDI7_9BASI|nr:hypothetical protein IE81DRAFT_194779 [Ceraceosorus guamensis]PWN45545.1 hypothetical protein IE81DRAFT_194779 [Ceraceosorus guamensis]
MRMSPLKLPKALEALPDPQQPYSIVSLYDSEGKPLHRLKRWRPTSDAEPRVRLHLAPGLHMLDGNGKQYHSKDPPPYTPEERDPGYQGASAFDPSWRFGSSRPSDSGRSAHGPAIESSQHDGSPTAVSHSQPESSSLERTHSDEAEGRTGRPDLNRPASSQSRG